MGEQVLGGGVIVLVAVALWLVYLLPSLHQRHQYNAAERNAVRLSQALRVLAETSETPEEVQVELNARAAHAQQRIAKRAQAEREQFAVEQARVQLERERAERAARRADPAARRARARRRLRLTMTTLVLIGLGVAAWGAYELVTTGAQLLLWVGAGAAMLAAAVLWRASRIGARTAAKELEAQERPVAQVQDVALEGSGRQWAPRSLPRPLTAQPGSRASAVLDAESARAALRQAALEEAMRARAEALRPPSIEVARSARAAADDAAIEAHVRRLLEQRASGQ
ncbi:large exoprotein [Microbacterium sp.]|uniref:large exoprotein n=1 Tax=Microbacterium sp. TaxID=51671 RepID=UPI0039E29691